VSLHVLQGERRIASQNRSLAYMRLQDIPPAPKEIPEIEVQFHIDANGILTVSAMDLTSGNRNEIQIESYHAVASMADPEGVVADADAHAAEDRMHMQILGVRRRLEEMESNVRAIRERRDGHLTEEQEKAAKEAFFKLEVALANRDWELIEEAQRNAKSVYIEIMSIHSLKTASAARKSPEANENVAVSEAPHRGED
jgi:molecular chaperone DnaK